MKKYLCYPSHDQEVMPLKKSHYDSIKMNITFQNMCQKCLLVFTGST